MAAQNPLQAQYSIPDLVAGVQPTGPEVAEFIQGGISVKLSFAQILAAVAASGSVRTRLQRSVTTTPVVIAPNDEILNCNFSVPAACALPASASRNGLPLTFKDVGANFGANNLTLTPNGAEKIDGAANKVLNVNHQVMTLIPANDGVNSGWSIG